MIWWAVEVGAAPEARDAIAAWLVNATGQAVVEQSDGSLVGFAPDETAARSLAPRLQAECPGDLNVRLRPVDAVDWSTRWRDGLGPRRVGRLLLVPTWLAPPEADGVLVRLDPETAFGSGEHGSTRAALVLLERLLWPGSRVIDLGSGSGILAIAAVKLGARRAIGIEIDPEAMPVALRNAERNGVAEQVKFLEGDAAALTALCAPAELILSNILRGPNVELLPVIGDALVPGGVAIFSGMEQTEAAHFLPELERAGFQPVDQATDEGWWATAAVRA
jgi:ribosomal protein L11 methyltransferase